MTVQLNNTVDTLARTLDGENESGGEIGMTSVANAICNRAKHGGWWGSSILEVCLKPEQFSCWLPGPDRDRILALTADNPNFALALKIAARAVMGTLADITDSADSYVALTLDPRPEWTQKAIHTGDIAGQAFFRTV